MHPSPIDLAESTDDLRSDSPLKYAQAWTLPDPLDLELGGQLPRVKCCYETWGTLNTDASNAVLVCHAISGDSHAARHDEDDDPGWWDDLIGPGRAIDTDQFFVVCPNVLGGCRGSTGPGDVDPTSEASGTPRRYGSDFPRITIGDMVEVQRALASHLGIDRWHAVVGGSLGGHQILQWVSRYPESVRSCVAIATSPRLTSQSLGFDVIARNAIQTDPNFAGGQYYDQPRRPDTGLAIARMLGHITYLSVEAMEAKFDPDRHDPRQIQSQFEQRFSIGSYLAHQGQKFVTRFDANSYVTLSLAMDLFDLGSTRLTLMETFDEATCDFLLVSFSSDWLFPPSQAREIVNALMALDKRVTYAEITTDAGHDAFLIARDIATYGPLVRERLQPPPTPTATDCSGSKARLETQGSVTGLVASHGDLTPAEESILQMIPMHASVLDLGCGAGELLAALRDRNHLDPASANGHLMGVEVAQENILKTAMRGLDVIDYDLNRGLPAFIDNQFDYVVLNATLQAVENVKSLLDEMLRVGRRCIVSFPNFAFRTLRETFIREGRCPRAPGEFDYQWYETPNRRFPTILDVHELLESMQVLISQSVYWDTSRQSLIDANDDPNLNADTAVLLIESARRSI
ncbi:MAG: homoserine O-acetyltransferase [Planctomycetota bacterium]